MKEIHMDSMEQDPMQEMQQEFQDESKRSPGMTMVQQA